MSSSTAPSPPDEPATLRATEPRDVVAAVPYLLGYRPERSVVLLGLVGQTPRRLGPIVRVDVEDVSLDPLAAGHQMGAVLRRVGVARCVLVVYSDAPPDWLVDFVAAVECPTPHHCLSNSYGVPGWVPPSHQTPVTDLLVDGGWQVGNGGFWPLGRPDLAVPDSTLQASPVSAALVVRGLSPLARREDREQALTPADAATRRWIAARVAALTPLTPDARRAALAAWLRRLAAPEGLPGRAQTATVLAALTHPWLRDAILVSAVHPVQRAHLADLVRDGRDDVLEVIFNADRVVAPHPQRTRRACDVLTHLARHATGAHAAHPLSALAWVSWWSGDGTWANQVNDRALAVDPHNPLALLVERTLAAGLPPMWVVDRPLAG